MEIIDFLLNCCFKISMNSFGLILDLIGAMFIFLNSPKISYAVILRSDEETIQLEKKARSRVRMTKIGALLLVIGFSLQLFSNIID